MLIRAFTHIGTKRQIQQDAILVNGSLLTEGTIILENQEIATCFVADGVAGSSDGAFAASYILSKLKHIHLGKDWEVNVGELLKINQDLVRFNSENGTNSASTLAGIYYDGDNIQIYQAGDCEIYLLRGKHFLPLAPVHNENIENIKKKYPGISIEQAYEKAANTITSFFGSQVSQLRFDKDWIRRIALPRIGGISAGDKLILCSDGLLKSISKKELLEVLMNKENRGEVMTDLINLSIKNGAIDNLSLILIED